LKKYNVPFLFPEKSPTRCVLSDALADVPDSMCAKYSETKVNLFKMIPQGGCWVNLPRHLQEEYLGKSFASGGGKRGILRRLSVDEPSLTILCSPSQKQTERCHPLYNRPLSIRESARIQTFPDSFTFHGSMSSQYRQIGNAIPVKMAEYMGQSIKDWLQQVYLLEV
jgi:DNA (cytosine-5)-methyltransferase 1